MKNYFDDIQSAWSRTGLKAAQGFFLIAGIVAVGFSYPSFQKYQASIDRDKATIDQITAQRRELQLQLESEKEQAEIANERYKTCLPVVGENFKNGTHYFAGIQEGMIIHDRITGKPLPQGTVICDAFGNTGTLDENGKVKSLAFTGNRALIEQRLKRFRGSQFSNPVINQ
ncbi:MAG: hypothetical protein KME29_12195 [Calothrix sp. FI2-JRJ7]|jgi:hypothetical protein|nr:hypothetical protein [Calothrix sp. FI2-JRJ7]